MNFLMLEQSNFKVVMKVSVKESRTTHERCFWRGKIAYVCMLIFDKLNRHGI